MEYRTPLLDCFRRGEVPRDVRLLAARGALAPRAQEQLALLVLLVGDGDGEIAAVALATIGSLPPTGLARFIARSDTPHEVRDFFTKRGVVPTRPTSEDDPLIPGEDAESGANPNGHALANGSGETADADAEERKRLAILNSLSVPQRLKIALKGTREQRAVLVRDPNRIVAAAVLSSPKLTDSEVEAFARMGNVSEDVLRTIGMTRAWTQNYSVCSALIRNAKTPLAISMALLPRMTDRDVKVLVTDRNIPEGLRLAARKMIMTAESRKQ
jgi:hypothetical protein